MDGLMAYALMNKRIGSLIPGYKGTVTSTSDLPASADEGDLYIVTGEGNANYFYDGSEWLCINPDIATTTEINGLY